MGIALAVFLVAIPAGFLLLSTRQPSNAAIRRLLATVLADVTTVDQAAIAVRVRRRRILSTVGAIIGLWLTAAFKNTTYTWNGLLSPLHYGQPVGLASGWLSLSGGSFLLLVNIWGVLAGFAVGLTISEWRGASLGFAEQRSARLEPRDSSRYLPSWTSSTTVLALAGALCALLVAAVIPDSSKSGSATGEVAGSSLSWWWASVLIGAGLLALGTRTAVLSSPPHAATLGELTAREATRALTAATLTIVALAAFVASTATTVGRISTWFGWGWGDGTVTGAIALSLLAIGLAISSFLTPYWAIGLRLDADAAVPA
jgi:hypothetical protein